MNKYEDKTNQYEKLFKEKIDEIEKILSASAPLFRKCFMLALSDAVAKSVYPEEEIEPFCSID